MEKDAIMKTRVAAKTKGDFDDICRQLGIPPNTKLRELIEGFVRAEYGRLADRVVVHIFQPSGYDFGAWRVSIRLRDPTELEWRGAPIPFAFPHLPHRLLHPDDGFLTVVPKSGTTDEMTIGGQFVNGEFRAHLYSNGVPEVKNATPIKQVRQTLTETVTSLLDRFGRIRLAEASDVA